MKKRFLPLIFILFFAIIPIPFVSGAWLPGGWDQRVKITVDSGDIDGALTNFPVLIYISGSSGINNEDITFVFDEVGPNSLKIAVTESDGTTECYVEVEKWDFGNEEAWLWVKGPSIASGSDTDFYLYFDNDHADNNAHVGVTNSVVAENVWDANFEFVSHMRDDPDNANIRDSTSKDNDGSKIGAGEPTVTTSGIIDDAQDYDGSNDRIFKATNDLKDQTLTVEAWVKTTFSNPNNWAAIVDYSNSINRFGWVLRLAPDGWGFVEEVCFNLIAADGGTIGVIIKRPKVNDNNWHYVVATSDGVDGTLQVDAGLAGTGTTGTAVFDTVMKLNIGSRSTGNFFLNLIDEVRVSNIQRTSAWIKATYETGRDDLLDFGTEESIKSPSEPNLLFGGGFNSSSPYVELHWNHSLENVQFFEVQNSTDLITWTHLGTSTTANYTDTQVVNRTERYYMVRACNQTGGIWWNSSFTETNFETVYFIAGGAVAGPSVGGAIGLIMLILICSPLIVLGVWRSKRR